MTDADWLDEIERDFATVNPLGVTCTMPTKYIARLIAEVRRLRALVSETPEGDRNMKWQARDAKTAHASILKDRNRVIEQNMELREENERLRWFEENFDPGYPDCKICDGGNETFGHFHNCEYVAHTRLK